MFADGKEILTLSDALKRQFVMVGKVAPAMRRSVFLH